MLKSHKFMLKDYENHYEIKKSMNFLEIDSNSLYIKFSTPPNKELL